MKRFHPLFNREYHRLCSILNYISLKIGRMLGKNPTFDERGLTDTFLDLLQECFKNIKLREYFINLQVNKPSEKKNGADILFRITFNRKEVAFDRYVLVQAKKYIKSSEKFSETNIKNKHLSAQVDKMHKYNPEFSYILFYSTSEAPDGNIILENSNTNTIIYFEEDSRIIESSGHFSMPVSVQGNFPITLLRSKTWERFNNISPYNLLTYSETLSNFLLDDLMTGKIGKEWDEDIEKAKGEFSFVIVLSIGQG